MEIWKEFFYDLLNREERPDIIERAHIPELDMHIEEPTIDCVRKAIKSLKNNKAPGLDNISAELIKHGGEILEFQLFKLIIKIWRVEAIPNDWDTGNIIPVHKKGDRTVCANYRGIMLLPVCYKVLTIIIKEKLDPYIENGLGEYQSGFRKGRSTIDHIFTIRQIMEKCWEYNKDIWQIFVDFKQAYDSINRASLWNIMAEFNIPSKLIKLVKACYNNSKACVQVGQRRTTEFGIKSGLRQGCLLSPILFNMVLEKVKRSIDEIQGGVDIGGVNIQTLAYADDVDVIGMEIDQVKEVYDSYKTEAERVGLVVNQNKTKIMRMSREEGQIGVQDDQVIIDGLEKVKEFKYLGSTLTSMNDMKKEIMTRIAAGNRCLYSLLDIIKKRGISRYTKQRIYNSIIRPITTYGCETWTLTKQLNRKLLVFENNVLRRITAPVFDVEENRWRRRHNEEVREIARQCYITDFIGSQRLRWLGHVARMEEVRLPRKIFEGTVEGRRPVGRPRKRWKDNVMEDLEKVGIQNPVEEWEDLARDRRTWRGLVREVMGLHEA